jgi:hypothetical protein
MFGLCFSAAAASLPLAFACMVLDKAAAAPAFAAAAAVPRMKFRRLTVKADPSFGLVVSMSLYQK